MNSMLSAGSDDFTPPQLLGVRWIGDQYMHASDLQVTLLVVYSCCKLSAVKTYLLLVFKKICYLYFSFYLSLALK